VPRKPTLSPSKITTYLACPLKYRWTYVDPRGKWYLRAKHYYSFGATLHKVLQRFHDEGDTGVRTASQAAEAIEAEWVGAGFATAEQEAQAQLAGQEIVGKYVEAALERPPEAKTLFLERMLRTDLGAFDLIGRLDRVDEHPDGTLEVIDYKTGRSEVTEESVASDIAMACYQLLLRRKFPDREVRGTILAVRTGSSASYAMPDAEMDEFERDIQKLGGQILETEWPNILPTVKPLCPECDFLPLCRKEEEFREAYQAEYDG